MTPLLLSRTEFFWWIAALRQDNEFEGFAQLLDFAERLRLTGLPPDAADRLVHHALIGKDASHHSLYSAYVEIVVESSID